MSQKSSFPQAAKSVSQVLMSDRPAPGDATLLVSEAALQGLIEGHIAIDRAIRDSLLVVTASSDAETSTTVLKILQNAFEQAPRF